MDPYYCSLYICTVKIDPDYCILYMYDQIYDRTWRHFVEKRLELVHPNLGRPRCIPVYDKSRATGKRVGCLFAENMANVGAGCNLEFATALPNLNRVQVNSLY